MTTHISKVARDSNLTETRDNKTFFLATTTTAKLSFARKILREPTLVSIGFTPLEPRDARGVWRRHASSEMAERRRGKQRPLEPVVASPRPAVRVKTEEDLPARDRERLSELCAAAVGLLWLALLLAAGRSPAEKKCRPFSVVLLLLLTMTSFPVGSTTLEAALASDSINGCFSDSSPCGNCYDPSRRELLRARAGSTFTTTA